MTLSRWLAPLFASTFSLTTAAALAADVVKIGFIDVLSGPFAQAGEGSLKQLREVVLQLNARAAAGEPKFEVVPFDGKGTPQESVTVLKAATDQGIRYITQGGGSGVAFALSDAVTKLSETNFESVAEIQLPIAGFTQTISTSDNAKRIGDCPPE